MEGSLNNFSRIDIPSADCQYNATFLNKEIADRYFEKFQQLPFQQGWIKMWGKDGKEHRTTVFYGDVPGKNYKYSGKDNHALEWTPELLELKGLVEAATNSSYDCCLINNYANGDDYIGWHSDDEKFLSPGVYIASVSLGAERRFKIKHKTDNISVEQRLAHGSLIVMGGEMQTHYKHSIPVEKKITTPRINITFRKSK